MTNMEEMGVFPFSIFDTCNADAFLPNVEEIFNSFKGSIAMVCTVIIPKPRYAIIEFAKMNGMLEILLG